MRLEQVTTEPTEADLEARIRAAIKAAFPLFPDGAIKHQLKFSFKFGRQTLVVDNGKSRAEARLDILLEQNGTPFAVMELKRPGITLSPDDSAQALSYARLVQPPAPLVVVTNGAEVIFLKTLTGEPWQTSTVTEESFKSLVTQANRIAVADIRDAIDTLMGTSPEVWMQAVRRVSADTIQELTASWDEPALPFISDFLAPRGATQKLWQNLIAKERLLVLEGPPLAGKSNVLRELCLYSEQSDVISTLYVETGVGHGPLQTLADALSRSLNWPISHQEARDWLIRLSHHTDTQLVLAFDGLQTTDTTAIREIEDLSSSAFGPSLSIVVAMDESVAQTILKNPSQRSHSTLGRRAKLVRVGYLQDKEFKLFEHILGQSRLYLTEGAAMAPEYRTPWVLRAIVSSAKATLKDASDDQALSLPPLLGLQLFDLVRERFSNSLELRRMFRSLARSMVTDAQDRERPHELVLQQVEMAVIRRETVRSELEPEDLTWLIDHGFVRPGMDEVCGPTILVRLPELLASEMAFVLAEDLAKRLTDVEAAAVWISGAASNLPLGELVAAQAIVDLAKRPTGLPIGLITALVDIYPEKEIIGTIGHFTMMLPNGGMADVVSQTDGKHFIIIDGKQHEFDLGEEEYVTFKNIHPWLILSYLATVPFELAGAFEEGLEAQLGHEDRTRRRDQDLLMQIATSPVPLRGTRGPLSMRIIPTMDLPNGISIVYPHRGIIEPITQGILNYLSTPGKQADLWVTKAAKSDSLALLSRVRAALKVLSEFKTHAKSKWANKQLRKAVDPQIRKHFQNLRKAPK